MSANLVRLSLQGNIVSYREGYRLYAVSKCPSLVVLDFEKVTLEEKKQADGKGGQGMGVAARLPELVDEKEVMDKATMIAKLAR